MAFRILKKKDGSPSKFAKIFKGVTKVLPFLPIPPAISKAVTGITDKVSKKTGVNLSKLAPKAGEIVKDYANRESVGIGAAAAAYTDNADKSAPGGVNPLVFGFAKEKVKAVALVFAGITGLYFFLKRLRVL